MSWKTRKQGFGESRKLTQREKEEGILYDGETPFRYLTKSEKAAKKKLGATSGYDDSFTDRTGITYEIDSKQGQAYVRYWHDGKQMNPKVNMPKFGGTDPEGEYVEEPTGFGTDEGLSKEEHDKLFNDKTSDSEALAQFIRWNIFARARTWKPYPEARAKKGEKGRADYKKEGRVGFFADFPEVPYWQGQLGLELYMDKVDFMEGKKKKRKKVAMDRLTERIYMYNPATEMYEEKTKADGYPTAAETRMIIFDKKICLAVQQNLDSVARRYGELKSLDFYLDEENDDLFDCNCNHLGKYIYLTGEKIIGQPNRYDWSKSDMDAQLFFSREQINLVLLEATKKNTEPLKHNLDEYEQEFADGLREPLLTGNETSILTFMSAHPEFEPEGDTDDIIRDAGAGGYRTMFSDIRSEEEKSMPIWDFTDIVLPDMVAAPPPKAEKPKKPKKEKKPRTQAQLDALAKAREKMAKKKAELKKSEK